MGRKNTCCAPEIGHAGRLAAPVPSLLLIAHSIVRDSHSSLSSPLRGARPRRSVGRPLIHIRRTHAQSSSVRPSVLPSSVRPILCVLFR